MAVTRHGTPTNTGKLNNVNTTITHPHTCTSGAKMLVVLVSAYDTTISDADVTGVTYNGVPLDYVVGAGYSGSNTNYEIFKYDNPPTGTSYNIVATFAAKTTNASLTAFEVTATNDVVVQASQRTTGTSGNPSVTVSGAASGSFTVGGVCTAQTVALNISVSTGTEEFEVDLGSATASDAYIADTGTLTWTDTDGTYAWNAAAVNLEESGPVEGSIIADALIATTQSDSVTANAVVKGTISDSISADSIKLRTESDSIAADAIVLTTEESSATADATIHATVEQSVTADSAIQKGQSDSITADASIVVTTEDSITADATIFSTISQDITADAAIESEQSDSITADASIVTTTTDSIDADAIILRVEASSVAADSTIYATISQDVTADAVIESEQSDSITADAAIVITVSDSVTADSAIQAEQQASITADVVILAAQSDSATADAIVHRLESSSITADSTIEKEQSDSITADAYIESGLKEGSITADSIIYRLESDSITADAQLVKTTEDSITADSTIKAEQTGSITADAAIFGSISDSITADSAVLRTESGSITVDAVIERTKVYQLYADATIHRTESSSITADAVIERTKAYQRGFDPENEGLSVWAAYEPDNASSFAESLNDISGNENDAGDPGGGATPDWAEATGWDFDSASSEYLTTAFVPDDDQSQSMIVQFSGYGLSGYIVGSRFGAARNFELRSDSGQVYYWNGDVLGVAPPATSGTLAVAGDKGYRNGSQESGTIGIYAGVNIYGLYIGCENSSGTPANFATVKVQKFYIYDETITLAQILTVHNAMLETFGPPLFADALIERIESSSITADATIGAATEDSIATDAIIYKEQAGSITADAEIIIGGVVVDSITADASIFATIPGSITVGAYIRQYIEPITCNIPKDELIYNAREEDLVYNARY